MNNKIVRNIHIIGGIFTILFGSLLHFTFELSGYWKPLAIISAVNESTWEHLKLAFWPTLIFAIIEYFIYGKKYKNFIFGKTISLYAMPILISVIFWGYLKVINDSLIWDILDFVISVVIGYVISYFIIVSKKYFKVWKTISFFLLVIIIISFCLLTFFPMNLIIFKDPITGKFGIPK